MNTTAPVYDPAAYHQCPRCGAWTVQLVERDKDRRGHYACNQCAHTYMLPIVGEQGERNDASSNSS